MSIQLNTENRVLIECSEVVTPREHLDRIKAIIELIQQRSPHFTNNEPVSDVLCLMEDMLPDEEQMMKALK